MFFWFLFLFVCFFFDGILREYIFKALFRLCITCYIQKLYWSQSFYFSGINNCVPWELGPGNIPWASRQWIKNWPMDRCTGKVRPGWGLYHLQPGTSACLLGTTQDGGMLLSRGDLSRLAVSVDKHQGGRGSCSCQFTDTVINCP